MKRRYEEDDAWDSNKATKNSANEVAPKDINQSIWYKMVQDFRTNFANEYF